jgi:hypothetical protein
MKIWWYTKDNNFGDVLTPYLLDHFNITYNFTSLEHADTICIGSIARRASNNVTVLGSGIMKSKEKLNPNANYKFVRGPLTRNKVIAAGGNCPEVYGDPALLLPLFCDESKKEYDVGIVPHFVDYKLVKEKYLNYKIINVVNTNPLEVAKEISKCRNIISSSLHGIIAAHAYNIPAAWVRFSDNIKGDGTKFYDHFKSMQIDAVLSTVDQPVFFNNTFDITPIQDIFKDLSNNQ